MGAVAEIRVVKINLSPFLTPFLTWTIDVLDKSINGGRMVEIKFK